MESITVCPALGRGERHTAGRIFRAAVALALVAAAAACRTRGDGGDASHPTEASAPELRLVQEAPQHLDPARVSTVYESFPVNQIFDGLVALEPSLNVRPCLATDWVRSRDGRVYLFRLRSDVRFHDGTPLTSRDVAFSFRRVLRPRDGVRSTAFSYLTVLEGAEDYAAGRTDDLRGLEIVGDHAVRLRLRRAYPSFLEVLAMDGLRIVPEAAVRRMGAAAFSRRPVGTGPYRLDAWDDHGLRLVANPDYFLGPPKVREVVIRFLREDEQDGGLAGLLDGSLDVAEIPVALKDRVEAREDLRIYRHQELSLSFLGILTGRPPLDDLRVRQAIAHAVNRQAIAALAPETRRLANGLLPPGMPGYSPRVQTLDHDPRASKRLLAEAGFPEGRGLPVLRLWTTARSRAAMEVAERIRADLDRVGIRIKVQAVGWRDFGDMIQDHAAELFLLAWIADLPDPDTFVRSLFETEGSANFFAFRDDEVTAMLEAVAEETHPVRRAELYRSLERRILRLAPMVPLYHSMGLLAMRRSVHGFEPGPMGIGSVDLERVWVEPESAR